MIEIEVVTDATCRGNGCGVCDRALTVLRDVAAVHRLTVETERRRDRTVATLTRYRGLSARFTHVGGDAAPDVASERELPVTRVNDRVTLAGGAWSEAAFEAHLYALFTREGLPAEPGAAGDAGLRAAVWRRLKERLPRRG